MNKIESTQNSTIKAVAKLHSSKERKKQQQFIVEGIRAVTTFLENGYKPIHLFITKEIPELRNRSSRFAQDDDMIYVSDSVMKKISTATTPSGVLAVFSFPKNPDPQELSSGVVLADITDPGNMGTLIRSAAAFGHKSVVIINGCDPFSPKVIQATAGVFPCINLFIWSWQELQQYRTGSSRSAQDNVRLIALVVKNGKTPQKITFNNTLFVVGNEAHGIKDEWVKDCDELLTLPMPGNTESLNAGVAGSIALSLPALFS